ncbi:hypothetical protein [Pseudomonas cannabina]|uniref:hypothetical protein n=1 Tax=Pseudomonas cannabina TaxID=86840 RepID=UPI00217F8B0C|nr:hypothetical protein [Pseudomonas cannabina]
MPAPDLILLDVQLESTNGLEGIALLQERWPLARVVIVSAFDRDQCARRSSAVRWSFTLRQNVQSTCYSGSRRCSPVAPPNGRPSSPLRCRSLYDAAPRQALVEMR